MDYVKNEDITIKKKKNNLFGNLPCNNLRECGKTIFNKQLKT